MWCEGGRENVGVFRYLTLFLWARGRGCSIFVVSFCITSWDVFEFTRLKKIEEVFLSRSFKDRRFSYLDLHLLKINEVFYLDLDQN